MPSLISEIAALRRMTVKQLRQKYADVFGEPTNAGHKDWLDKRVAWRLQAKAEGVLSDRARRRAEELANDADLRLSPPKEQRNFEPEPAGKTTTVPFALDQRLPPPGSTITQQYKGRTLQVQVRDDGLEYDGQLYRSLSAVAKAITGGHCNGYLFFRIQNGGDA